MTGVRDNLASAFAPAKVNLYLHVGPPGAGGLHPLDSLVMFADQRAADRISVRSYSQLRLNLDGSNARALKNAPHNLVLGAAAALREAAAQPSLTAMITLHKELPVAGGIGGGSADAAATLHLLNRMWALGFATPALERIAMQLGSDVPACVRGRPAVMRGVGERVDDADAPDLPVLLVNPGVALETRKVYARFDQLGAPAGFAETPPPAAAEASDFIAALRRYRNDLEPAAFALSKEVGRTVDLLAGLPGAGLARMSGSGSTCFALFADAGQAQAAAERISKDKKNWWVRSTTLRGGDTLAIAATPTERGAV